MFRVSRRNLMFASVIASLGIAAVALVGDEGINRLEGQRRNLRRLTHKKDRAELKAKRFEALTEARSVTADDGKLVGPHREKLIRESLGVIAADEVEVTLR